MHKFAHAQKLKLDSFQDLDNRSLSLFFKVVVYSITTLIFMVLFYMFFKIPIVCIFFITKFTSKFIIIFFHGIFSHMVYMFMGSKATSNCSYHGISYELLFHQQDSTFCNNYFPVWTVLQCLLKFEPSVKVALQMSQA